MDLGTLNWSVEVDTADLSRAEREMDGTREAATGAKRGVDDFGDSTTRAGRKVRTATERMERDFRSTSRATDMLRNAVSGLVGALGVREVIRYADAWQNAENQLRMVTNSTRALADVQQRLVDVSIDTRSNFSATANLYARLARSTTELGLSQQDLIGLTTTINQSFAVSGATAEEASAAITQLSQGLAAGALRGDEFNSVAEQAPGILRAVAESLNMGIGELREFAATGGITAEIVVNALQGASESIATDFAGSVATFGQQMEVARTQMTQFVGENSNVQGVVSALGNAIVGVTGVINEHSTAFNVVTGAIGGAATAYYGYAIAAGVAQKATVLFMRVLKVNPLILAATAIASIGGALYAARDASIEFGDTQGTLAQWMQATWTTLSNIVGTTFGSAVDTASAKFGDFGQGATRVLSYLWETFKALIGNIANGAKWAVNIAIGYWMTLGDTARIVGTAIIEGFRNAFDNVVKIAKGFGEGLQAMLDGDFSFTSFRSALREGIVDPMREAAAEVAASARENLTTDHLGDFVEFTGEAVRQMGQDVQRQVKIMNTEFRTLDGWLLKAPESISKIPPELEEVGKKAKESATSVSRLDESVNSLLNRLDPVRARTQAYAQGVSLLNTALATGTLNFGDYQRGMVALQEELYNLEDATDVATEEMTRELERFGNAIDDVFVDAFKGAFDSFESFADRLKGAFENLMAELAYAAVKNEIKIQLGMGTSGPMSGGIGQLFGGQGGGLGLSNLGSIGSSINWMGAPTSYTSGFGSQVATGGVASRGTSFFGGSTSNFSGATGLASAGAGFVGSWGAGSVFGESAEQEIGSTLGGAVGTYLGGPVGAAIGSFLGGAVGSLFGGETTPRLNISTYGDAAAFGHESVSTGAFGAVGFSEGTRRSNDLFGSIENERAWLDSVASLDNMLASVAQSPEQLDAMRSAVQGVVITAGDAATANDMLVQRTTAAANVIDAEFTAALVNAGATAEQITQRFVSADAAMQTLNAVAERLNLQWDSGAEAALRYADAIANQVGGVQNMAAIQQAYYSTAFTETERLSNAQADLYSSLSSVTDQVPRTVAELRKMVEAQDLNSEAGARLALDLMSLAPALRESSSAVRDAIEAHYQSALGREADTEGLNYWFEQVSSGSVTLTDALDYISNSAEAAARDVTGAADDFSALDSAMSALQKSVREETSALREQYQARKGALTTVYQDEKAALQSRIQGVGESIQRLTSITQMLSSAVQDTELDTLALQRSRRTQAQGFLASQLAAGRVTDVGALEQALDDVRQPSEALYSTFADYARDQLTTSNVISQLEEKTEDALSIEEKMLKELQRQEITLDDNHRSQLDALERQHNSEVSRLDGILERAQQQVDAIKGVDSSIMSVLEALGVFNDVSTGAGGDSVSGGGVSTGGGGTAGASKAIEDAYRNVLDAGVGGFEIMSWEKWISEGTGRLSRIDEAIAWENLSTGGEDWLRDQGLFDAGMPKFKNGGNHAGGWRMVGEDGPEIEYTGPSRITSNNDIMRMNDDLTAEVKQLREDLREVMRPIAANTGRSADTLEGWDYGGGPPVREEVDA